MKPKVVIVVLLVACVILVIAFSVGKKHADEQRAADITSIIDYSNQVVNVNLKNTDLKQVNLALTNDLVSSQQQSADLSNKLDAATVALNASKNDLAEAQSQISSLNSHISDLEKQNQSLVKRSGELSNNIVQLDHQISITRDKLAHSKSDNNFLQQELQRQMAQRAELEHKFNDLDALRQQVKKIKTELFVARRLRLMHNSNQGKKGAELLMHPNLPTPESVAQPAPFNGLNVEIGSDGSVKVIPPLVAPVTNSVTTNSAAQ